MVFEVFGHYQHIQPVGHSAALIGSLQSSMSAASNGQNKNAHSHESSSGISGQTKQSAPSQVTSCTYETVSYLK